MPHKLTEREEKIVALVAAGMRNEDIAAALGITENSIRNQIREIYDKSGFDSRLQLALWYVKYREKRFQELDYEI
jgi:DNA-binding NarL/FixJ family response regulator